MRCRPSIRRSRADAESLGPVRDWGLGWCPHLPRCGGRVSAARVWRSRAGCPGYGGRNVRVAGVVPPAVCGFLPPRRSGVHGLVRACPGCGGRNVRVAGVVSPAVCGFLPPWRSGVLGLVRACPAVWRETCTWRGCSAGAVSPAGEKAVSSPAAETVQPRYAGTVSRSVGSASCSSCSASCSRSSLMSSDSGRRCRAPTVT